MKISRRGLTAQKVKEGQEHSERITDFVAGLLKDALNLEKTPLLVRAHHTLRSKPINDNELLCAFVVRGHYFSEKEYILKKAVEFEYGSFPISPSQ